MPDCVAERGGFEPPKPFRVYTLSSRAVRHICSRGGHSQRCPGNVDHDYRLLRTGLMLAALALPSPVFIEYTPVAGKSRRSPVAFG